MHGAMCVFAKVRVLMLLLACPLPTALDPFGKKYLEILEYKSGYNAVQRVQASLGFGEDVAMKHHLVSRDTCDAFGILRPKRICQRRCV